MQKIKLYCLPYAGGSANFNLKWDKYLPENIEICPLELAGRGKRYNEPFFQSIDEAVDNLYNSIKYEIDIYKYAFYGHSMGTIIIYELVNKILKKAKKAPIKVFLSGRQPPHLGEKRIISQLDDNRFIEEVIKAGGTNDELINQPELLRFFIPILRADYKMAENYRFNPKDKLVWNIDLILFNGKSDTDVSAEEMNEWNFYTTGKCELHEFEGNHFFIYQHGDKISRIINNSLNNYL